MKIWCGFCAVIAVFALIVGGCSSGGGGGDSTPSPPATSTYTALVYMVGSDLESKNGAGTNDLVEMTQVGSTSAVNLIVETGGASQWQNTLVSSASVQRWRVASGDLESKSDLGNLNMGDPATLQDFITWGVANYPADKYVLILWDHGSGAIGTSSTGVAFGSDENHGGDGLSLPELQQALQNAYATTGKKFDVIGFDACLMATVEVASTIRPYASYLVASEELEPGHGWDYAAILSAIRSNPAISGSSLGRVIADGYRAQAIAQGTALRAQGDAYNQDQAITLSVVDLSQLSPIIAALEALTTAAGTDIQTSGQSARIQLAAGRSRAEDYGNDKQNNSYLDLADVKHLASQLATAYPSETSSLISALDSAVVYKISGSARPNANGLSLFFPHKNINNSTLSAMVQAYNALDFSEIYQTFVGQYVTLGDQDATAPAFAGETFDGTVLSGQVQGGDVDSVYAVITLTDPATGTGLIIGVDTVDTQDAAGNVTYAWDGQWLTLNGKFVSVYPDSTGGTIETYLIPALLNGQGVDILVKVDTTTDEIVILGAWPGIVNGVAAREILPIEAGDVITPTFFLYDVTTETTQEVAGTPFAVGASGVELGVGPLPSGSYYLGFLATDYAQNVQNSQFVAVNVP